MSEGLKKSWRCPGEQCEREVKPGQERGGKLNLQPLWHLLNATYLPYCDMTEPYMVRGRGEIGEGGGLREPEYISDLRETELRGWVTNAQGGWRSNSVVEAKTLDILGTQGLWLRWWKRIMRSL